MDCDLWQYKSSGRVDGINGNVDMNTMYMDLISKIGECGGDEPSKPDNKENEATYYTVQSGDTLSKITSNHGTTYR